MVLDLNNDSLVVFRLVSAQAGRQSQSRQLNNEI